MVVGVFCLFFNGVGRVGGVRENLSEEEVRAPSELSTKLCCVGEALKTEPGGINQLYTRSLTVTMNGAHNTSSPTCCIMLNKYTLMFRVIFTLDRYTNPTLLKY